MIPGKYDLTLYRGDSDGWTFTCWDDEDKTDPTDLTDATPTAQIRATTEATEVSDLVCLKTLPNIINVWLPVITWDTLTIKAGVWDLELTYSSGEVKTLLAGKVTITADVTKP